MFPMTPSPVNPPPFDIADRNARPVPLYEHVKRQMSEAILMGALPPGTVLPGEIQMAAQYGVAVGTMRRALADLTAEGMLMRRRKTGTVVTGRSPHHSLRFFFQYFRLHGSDGKMLRSKPDVMDLSHGAATKAEAASFALEQGSTVIRIHRLRRVEGAPVMHEWMTFPAHRLPDFPDTAAAVPDLLYRHLLERYGIRISAIRESLTADTANAEDRRLLGLGRHAAVLVIDEIAYDQNGAAMILCHHRAITNGYCYVNEVR